MWRHQRSVRVDTRDVSNFVFSTRYHSSAYPCSCLIVVIQSISVITALMAVFTLLKINMAACCSGRHCLASGGMSLTSSAPVLSLIGLVTSSTTTQSPNGPHRLQFHQNYVRPEVQAEPLSKTAPVIRRSTTFVCTTVLSNC